MSHVLDDLDFFTECIDKGQWFYDPETELGSPF